ncbi:MAG: Ppx/GppA phosphatase family protein [Bacteroidota bacterium]
MRLTAIDIGTNTILMLIAEISEEGKVTLVRDEIAFPRLGKGVDDSGMISAQTFGRVVGVLKNYKQSSDALGSEKVIACGTSAMRDSRNRHELIQIIKRETSIDVEVLTGDEEARWTFIGTIFDSSDREKHFAVIDIGGGSTEVTLGASARIEKQVSLDLGCVRLTERFLRSAPPPPKQLEQARLFAKTILTSIGETRPEKYDLVGVAGTVTTLAALDQELTSFDGEKVNGYLLTLERIERIFARLRLQTLEQICSSPLIALGRADVLLAGTLILIEFMSLYGFDSITVSNRGLRYGLALREFERSKRILTVR